MFTRILVTFLAFPLTSLVAQAQPPVKPDPLKEAQAALKALGPAPKLPAPAQRLVTEVEPTEAEKPFLGVWRSNSDWKYEFVAGGKGTATTDKGKVYNLRWKTYGNATFKHVPDKFGGVGDNRERSWTGPSVKFWFGDDDAPPKDTILYGLYTIEKGYDILAFTNFYDGRDWHTRVPK